MKNSALTVALVLIAVNTAPSWAQSNVGGGSIKVNKLGDASKIEPSRPQVSILNTGPIVTDHRERPQAPDTLQVYLEPLGAAPGNQYVYGTPGLNTAGAPIQLQSTSHGFLAPPSDMHRSNMSARPAVDTSRLPSGGSTGIHGPLGPMAGPPKQQEQRVVSGTLHPVSKPQQVAQGYKPYDQPGGASTGQAAASTKVIGRVIPKTTPGPLSKRLMSK
jgi:hypothetical protein